MTDLIDPFLYSKFILLLNDSFNKNNDLGFLNEYVELLYNLYTDFINIYKDIISYNEEEAIKHFIFSEHCTSFMKDNLHLELNYV